MEKRECDWLVLSNAFMRKIACENFWTFFEKLVVFSENNLKTFKGLLLTEKFANWKENAPNHAICAKVNNVSVESTERIY